MHALEQQLIDAWPLAAWSSERVAVAVSGGPDSVALLRALAAVAPAAKLLVVHVHHGLREAADQDRQFVEQLAQQLNLPCDVRRLQASDFSDRPGVGIEGAAREARYEALRDAAERFGARYLVTAHTADDQVETILHRILRGTGIAGLSGMRRTRPLSPAVTLLRPLLGIARRDVLKYLETIGQASCDDETNRDTRFTRSRIRGELLPALERDYNPAVREALLRLAVLARETDAFVSEQAEAFFQKSVRIESQQTATIDCAKLAGQPALLVREVCVLVWKTQRWPLRHMSHAHWVALGTLVKRQVSDEPVVMNLPGNVRAKKEGEQLSLTRLLSQSQ